jgi:hypothetical protein
MNRERRKEEKEDQIRDRERGTKKENGRGGKEVTKG